MDYLQRVAANRVPFYAVRAIRPFYNTIAGMGSLYAARAGMGGLKRGYDLAFGNDLPRPSRRFKPSYRRTTRRNIRYRRKARIGRLMKRVNHDVMRMKTFDIKLADIAPNTHKSYAFGVTPDVFNSKPVQQTFLAKCREYEQFRITALHYDVFFDGQLADMYNSDGFRRTRIRKLYDPDSREDSKALENFDANPNTKRWESDPGAHIKFTLRPNFHSQDLYPTAAGHTTMHAEFKDSRPWFNTTRYQGSATVFDDSNWPISANAWHLNFENDSMKTLTTEVNCTVVVEFRRRKAFIAN